MDINEGILLIKKLTHKKSCSPQRLGKVSIDGENNYANALDSPFREKKKSVDSQAGTSAVKVMTEVFLSKIKMLSPESKSSGSIPRVSIFPCEPSGEFKNNSNNQSYDRRSRSGQKKQHRFENVNIQTFRGAELAISPLLN